jgi:hypothetical protein
MPDSVEETKPQGPTAIIVRGPHGELREALKGRDGKFVRKERKLATKKDIQDVTREFLTTKLEKDPNGKMTKRSKTRLHETLEAMHKLSTNDNPVVAAAAVKAAEFLWLYAFGKPSMSDKDRSAMELAGVKYVIVEAPELMHPEVIQEQPKPVLKPSFSEKPQIIEPEYIMENPRT